MPKNKQRSQHRNHTKRNEKKMEAVQRLNPFVSNYIKKLESENERMKTDPDTTVGQLIMQMRDAVAQNKRLSVLAATLLEAQGGSVTLTKDALEAFETKVLNIKWTLPEGVEKVEDASEFIFTYEAVTQEEAAAQEAPTPTAKNDPVSSESVEEITLEEFQEVIAESDENHEKLLGVFREQQAQKFIEESGKQVHTNDCATSVSPAEEPGPCDCEVQESLS